MLRRTLVTGLTVLVSASLVGTAFAAAPAGGDWQLDEVDGTTLVDLAGTPDSGATFGEGVTRTTFADGNRGLTFTKLGNVTIPHSADLRPGAADVTLDIRVKPNGGGDQNVFQKGQFAATSQMIKMEIVGNSWNCIFRGSNGDFRVGNGGSPTRPESIAKDTLVKGRWQTVQCVKKADRIALVVNGVEKAYANVAVGNLDTFGKPVTIGGKVNCGTHCDYFGGAVDYARFTIG